MTWEMLTGNAFKSHPIQHFNWFCSGLLELFLIPDNKSETKNYWRVWKIDHVKNFGNFQGIVSVEARIL